jgi:hypothetical protein
MKEAPGVLGNQRKEEGMTFEEEGEKTKINHKRRKLPSVVRRITMRG